MPADTARPAMSLPPLHALRAFDAVGRLGSVRAASQVLFVTPGAITQQLRVLEEYFGKALVEHRGRGLVLTEAGQRLHADTSRHLQAIAVAAESLRCHRACVRVTAAHSVAARWLVPKLQSFGRAHPDIDVLVDASAQLLDLRAGGWDVGLREGDGHYPGHESTRLFALDVVPVAAAEFLSAARSDPRGYWMKAHLLHDVGNPLWRRWLDAAEIEHVDASKGTRFSNTEMAIAAAVAGQGVALTPLLLVSRELFLETLVLINPRALVTGSSVYAVWPKQDAATPAARVFSQWLIDEAAADHGPIARPSRSSAALPLTKDESHHS